MQALLPLLELHLGRNVMPFLMGQDAAGPCPDPAQGCPTGAYCLGMATPPVDELYRVLGRREIKSKHRPLESYRDKCDDGFNQLHESFNTNPEIARSLLLSINFAIVNKCINIMKASCRCFVLLNDAFQLRAGAELTTAEGIYIYIHLDDVAVLAGCPHLSTAMADCLDTAFTKAGFLMKRKAVGNVDGYIGLVPQISPPTWRPKPVEMLMLELSHEFLQQQRWLRPAVLQSVIALCIHFALLWRASLAVPHALYALSRKPSTYVRL